MVAKGCASQHAREMTAFSLKQHAALPRMQQPSEQNLARHAAVLHRGVRRPCLEASLIASNDVVDQAVLL